MFGMQLLICQKYFRIWRIYFFFSQEKVPHSLVSCNHRQENYEEFSETDMKLLFWKFRWLIGVKSFFNRMSVPHTLGSTLVYFWTNCFLIEGYIWQNLFRAQWEVQLHQLRIFTFGTDLKKLYMKEPLTFTYAFHSS